MYVVGYGKIKSWCTTENVLVYEKMKCVKSRHYFVRVYLMKDVSDDVRDRCLQIIDGDTYHLVKMCDCMITDESLFLDRFGRPRQHTPSGIREQFIPTEECWRYIKGREEMAVFPVEGGIRVPRLVGVGEDRRTGVRNLRAFVRSFTIHDTPASKRDSSISFREYYSSHCIKKENT